MAETRTREVTGVDPAQWMALLQQGDEEALEKLLTHYDGMLRYIAGGILEAPQDREDCLAQVRLKLWESRGQYDPARSSPATWLTALCRNAAVDHLRRLQRQGYGELSETHPDPAPGPEEQAERREVEERLRALVESMEEPDRTLFLRYYYEEEPLDQVCRDLKMRPSTARSRLCRGRRKLKERLTQEGGMLDAQSHP